MSWAGRFIFENCTHCYDLRNVKTTRNLSKHEIEVLFEHVDPHNEHQSEEVPLLITSISEMAINESQGLPVPAALEATVQEAAVVPIVPDSVASAPRRRNRLHFFQKHKAEINGWRSNDQDAYDMGRFALLVKNNRVVDSRAFQYVCNLCTILFFVFFDVEQCFL